LTDSPAAFGVETIELDLPQLVGAVSRRLHDRGVPTAPARSAELARALALVRPIARRQLYWTMRAVLVSDRAQVQTFDSVFFSIFGDRPADDGDASVPEDTRSVATPGDGREAAQAQVSQQDAPGGAPSPTAGDAGDTSDAELELLVARASDEEVLRQKNFDALDAHELAQLYRLMSQLELATPLRRSRRYERRRRGERVDMRRTLGTSLRTSGDPIRLARRRRRVLPRRLVLLCDISGSMEPYARAYLQFLACGARTGPNAEAFVFATRLTRVTRALASRNPERAIQRAASVAPDWSSGTRIGDALREFNDRHGRRGMARGAVVVILSDGWERGDPILVGREMARLARLAHRIVWVNPRVSADGFSVQSGGMLAALPHCDALVSGHSFEALAEVAEAIGAEVWDAPDEAVADTSGSDEPWPSATPAPGSSVAMPSGDGPSRGNTTPGWVTE
jgi:uncharacterized protein